MENKGTKRRNIQDILNKNKIFMNSLGNYKIRFNSILNIKKSCYLKFHWRFNKNINFMLNSIKIIIETSFEFEGSWFRHKEELLLLKI